MLKKRAYIVVSTSNNPRDVTDNVFMLLDVLELYKG